MFKVSLNDEVLYRGWCQHEALDVLVGNPASTLEIVEDVHVNSLDEATLFSQLHAMGVESGSTLKDLLSETFDKMNLNKESVETFLSDVQDNGNAVVETVKKFKVEGTAAIGEALTRLGSLFKRVDEETKDAD